MSTIEDKLQNKKDFDDLKKCFPEYSERPTLNKGSFNILCKLIGHKRIIHHAFFKKITERGTERYECYVCVRCKDVLGKLVMIT